MPKFGFRSEGNHISLLSSLLLPILVTGTTWDRLITCLVSSHMHLVCRMGIVMLSTMEALEGKGSKHKQEIPCHPTLKQREDAQYLNQETSGSPDT